LATRIGNLLDGLTLAEAAVLADKIKEWDQKPPEHPDTFLACSPTTAGRTSAM
jgi:hypothetical protein